MEAFENGELGADQVAAIATPPLGPLPTPPLGCQFMHPIAESLDH